MTSPAKRHFLRHQAAAAASAEPEQQRAGATGYELMMAQLIEDRRTLKGIQSQEQKAKVKEQMLPKYAPWIQGVLESGSGAPDEILTTVMVWFLDAGIPRGALEIAEYVLKHDLPMPDRFERNTATVVAEEIAEISLKQLKVPDLAAGVDVGALLAVERLVEGRDMPDQARAKLHKAIGYALRLAPDIEQKQLALDHLQRALQLHDNVGVKKDIEVLERELKASSQQQQTNTGTNTP